MPETIGQRLKQIRLSRQLSIEKAAEATRVRVVYLQALEEDNYSAMSSAAQGRGFLRLYADFLGLDLESAMTDLRQGGTVDAPPEAPAPVAAPQTPPASSRTGSRVAAASGRVSCEGLSPRPPPSWNLRRPKVWRLWTP